MNYIINPVSGEKVNIISQSGKQILKNYINIYNNGGSLRAERTGDTTVRITSSSPSDFAEDIYVPENDEYFDLFEDQMEKINSNLKQIKDTTKHRINKPYSKEPIDIRARSITPPNIDYVNRYDKTNKKLNNHYQMYMDKADMYLTHALENGYIDLEDISYRLILGYTNEQIAKGVADKYFHDSRWLGENAFEYYGKDYAWFHSPFVRNSSPPPKNTTDFEDEEISDLELDGGSKRKRDTDDNFKKSTRHIKRAKRRGSFDIPFFRSSTELEAIEKEARDKGMDGDGILTSPVSEFIKKGTLDEESKKMLDHLDKYLSRFTPSPLPKLSPSPTLPPPPPTIPKPTPRRSNRLKNTLLTGGDGDEYEIEQRELQELADRLYPPPPAMVALMRIQKQGDEHEMAWPNHRYTDTQYNSTVMTTVPVSNPRNDPNSPLYER